MSIEFGWRKEWECFAKRNPKFIENFEWFHNLVDRVFKMPFDSEPPANKAVYMLCRLCSEDYSEILLLCGNGYGYGGMKILRGMYERVVNAAYIAENPQSVSEFIDYQHMHEWKFFNHAKKTFEDEDFSKIYSVEKIASIEENYLKVKEQFQQVVCKTCNTFRDQFSWSKLDLLSMANKVGLKRHYLGCYYEPTLHAHSTPVAIDRRMKEKDDVFCFDGGPQRSKADTTLMFAHFLMLCVLRIQNNFFHFNLNDELNLADKEYSSIWS